MFENAGFENTCGKLMEDGHVSPASPTTRHLEPWVLSKGVWLGSLSPPQSTPLSEEPRQIQLRLFLPGKVLDGSAQVQRRPAQMWEKGS